MRPKRLELEGFGSFRDRTVVDFEGAELFVLSGPTGSGKSTIIDGITFALYGAVPRYQKSNLVRPAISNGKEEARVRLDFEVGGEEYTAVRVVRRTATGASTREARLVQGETVLGGTADEVSTGVEELLGLSFDHFQKCVVLPQGAFAQLLHDAQANRLALLRSLLGIEIFSRMRELANGRARDAKDEWNLREARLANELAEANEEWLATARQRVEALAALVTDLREESTRLADLGEELRATKAEMAAAETAIAKCAAIRLPRGLDELAGLLQAARDELAGREEQAAAAETVLEAARTQRANQPDRDGIERLLRLHDDLGEVVTEIERLGDQQAEAARAVETAADNTTAAEAALKDANIARETVFRENHAAAAARGLKAGDSCPICGEVLREAPHIDEPANLKEADAKREAAEKEHRARVQEEQLARSRLDASEQQVARSESRKAEFEAALAGKPERAECAATLSAIADADAALEQAQREWSASQSAVRVANEAVVAANQRTETAIRELDAARDSLAAYGPPALDRHDIAGAWRTLVEWAGARLAALKTSLDDLGRTCEQLEGERMRIVATQRERCRQAEIEVDENQPLEAAASALGRAEDTVSRVETMLATVKELREEQDALVEQERVASTLARHLRADKFGFETWYVRQVVEHLTFSASETLLALSRGQFSLALAENEDFEVIDHTNADARRHIRTLSGGETFLASLALALALADSIAMVAAGSTARLDAIFLDEGFGTLDPETLDVVATAIEELSAGGRMVGLVTHVSELAARMPVRFEVRRGPGGSTVQRVEV